jgi:predicted negative regulator of RcsB-dependent stress response
MNNIIKVILYTLLIIVVILVIVASICWTIYQWHLCRDAGLPFWYCVQHIS